MELSNDYLTLKLCRLRNNEEMDLDGRGLVFVILKHGVGVCQCHPLPHWLASGDVLVVDGARGGKLRARDNGEMEFWVFVAELEHLYPLFSGREICWLQSLAEGFKAGRVYSGSSSLARQCIKLAGEIPAQASFEHRSHLLRVVSAILNAEFKAQQPKLAVSVPMRDNIIQVFDRLQTNEILTMSVGELAKKFNCSRRHLNRLFHQHFGVSVASMRMEMRLLKAVSLLVDPDAKVICVAEKCGFNHLGLFNTCFKKRFGTSPGQWRNLINQTSNHAAEARAAGALLEGKFLASASVKNESQKVPGRVMDKVALSGLLKDIVALKNGIKPQDFVPGQAGRLAYAAAVTPNAMIPIDT